jgi:hypothetical protein
VAVKGSRHFGAGCGSKGTGAVHTTYNVHYTFLHPQRPAWLLGTGQPLLYGQRLLFFFILVTRLLLIQNMP